MEPAALIAFAGLCLYACTRPAVALALIILMFPAEIVLQGVSPALRSSGLGLKAVNIAVGAVALIAASGVAIRSPAAITKLLSPACLSVYALFGWSAITLLWSPGAEAGSEVIMGQLPYFFVILVLAPLLISSIDEFAAVTSAILLGSCVLCCIVLVSPEFVTKDTRLGFELGTAARSNPLALGEMGGLGIIFGMLARRTTLGAWALPLRAIAVTAGAAVAIQSGSRGQFFYALAIAVAFLPVSAPVKNLRGFILTTASVAFVLIASYILLGSILFGAAEKRFSIEGLLYGSSSSETRVANVLALAGAWADRPFALIAGLGFYAFNGLFADTGNIYSHVLFADMIFEEGIPGLFLFGSFMFVASSSAVGLVRRAAPLLVARTSAAILVAMFAYQILLVNKQGTLWGSMPFFLFGLLIVDMHRSFEPQSSEDQDPWLSHD
jgi:hypothetical protein